MTKSIYYWNPTKNKINDLEGIRKENTNASIPDGADVSVLGYYPLTEPEAPSFDSISQTLVWVVEQKQGRNGPEFVRKYSVSDLPTGIAEEKLQVFIEQQKKNFITDAQKSLDKFAQERGYDDIKSAIGYLQSNIPQFRHEAEVCLQKRDEMWSSLFEVLDKVKNNQIPLPKGFSDITEYLPVMKWN